MSSPPLLSELRYAHDRDLLLRGQQGRKRFYVPAQVLGAIIRELGYRVVRRAGLPDDVLAYCDFENRQVVVATDFARRLDRPQCWRAVWTATLAHELGHIRLHERLSWDTAPQDCWEDEATLYAQVFLVPRSLLMNRLETRCLCNGRGLGQSLLWSYVLRLAREFQVSGAFMVQTLRVYGLIDFNSRTRYIRVRPPRLARPVSGPRQLAAV